MHALKKVKMKKAKLFSTKDAVREARFSLEKEQSRLLRLLPSRNRMPRKLPS